MTTAFRADTTHVEMGGGKFDSRNRYIRAVAIAADKNLNMVRGPSIEIHVVKNGVNTNAAWRWQVGAATMTGSRNGVSPPTVSNTAINAAI